MMPGAGLAYSLQMRTMKTRGMLIVALPTTYPILFMIVSHFPRTIWLYRLETNPPNFKLLVRIEEAAPEKFQQVATNGDVLAYGYENDDNEENIAGMPSCFHLKSIGPPNQHDEWHLNVRLADLDVCLTFILPVTLLLLTVLI
jgi:hypothetical protein